MVNNDKAFVTFTMVNGEKTFITMTDREVKNLRLGMFSARNTGWVKIEDSLEDEDYFVNLDNVVDVHIEGSKL